MSTVVFLNRNDSLEDANIISPADLKMSDGPRITNL